VTDVTGSSSALGSRHVMSPARQRRPVPWMLVAVWGALFFNVLAFSPESSTVVPIPSTLGKLLTQGSLVVALLLALIINRRVVLRPNLFLVLFTMVGVVALMVSIHNEFLLGSTYRSLRLLGFLAVLWLLTPWWGRRDMLLLRCHRRVLWAILATVIVGATISPGLAFAFEGRLSGVVWPIPPTQVAHYAAILFGTTVVLWMCRVITGRHVLIALVLSGAVLLGTHTRTATVGTLVGLAVAGGSLFVGHVRARRFSALGAVFMVLLGTVFASEITNWAMRGQTAEDAAQLTGRTKVWEAVFGAERPRLNDIFGSGLSNQSFNGLAIDSTWVGSYWDQGWFGVVSHASIFVLLILVAATRDRSPQRAVALFLVMYSLVASFTETAFGNPSSYVLDLAVAAALLAPEVPKRRT
jgi:hypothetical protein